MKIISTTECNWKIWMIIDKDGNLLVERREEDGFNLVDVEKIFNKIKSVIFTNGVHSKSTKERIIAERIARN